MEPDQDLAVLTNGLPRPGRGAGSTGPRSEEGKARSSMNALTVALTARQGTLTRIGGGGPMRRLQAAIESSFPGMTAVERELAKLAAAELYRLQRADAAERELWSPAAAVVGDYPWMTPAARVELERIREREQRERQERGLPEPAPEPPPPKVKRAKSEGLNRSGHALELVNRYRTGSTNRLLRLLDRLERLYRLRMGEPLPAPQPSNTEDDGTLGHG